MTGRQPIRLLLVAPTEAVREALEEAVRRHRHPYALETADSPQEAAARWQQSACDVVLLDCTDGDRPELESLAPLATAPVIVLAVAGLRGAALRAVRRGAQPWPVDAAGKSTWELLPVVVERAIACHREVAELRDLEERVEQRTAVLKAINRELRRQIAGRTAVENALRREQDRCHMLVQTIPHGITEVDLDGAITFANAAYHRMHGYAPGELIGAHVADLLPPGAETDHLREYLAKLVAQKPAPTPYFTRHRSKTGEILEVRVDWNYKRDDAGGIAGFVNAVTDITEHRRAEEQAQQRLNELAHVARLSTMGEMVSGLAHELNQPLSAITNYAQFCRHRLQQWRGKNRDEVRDAIDQIAEQAGRASEIIRRLREFIRREPSHRASADINELVRDVAALLQVQIRLQSVRLELLLGDSLPKVYVDRIQIEQVVTNLVSNAIEALGDDPQRPRSVTIRTARGPANVLEVSVVDTGRGLPTADVSRLFEPFYTSKPGGMGLGLSISRSIVEAHGGRLEAAHNPHGGATFRFTLPVHAEGGAS
jgi:two-component system sensor kinase FixL